MMRLPAFVLAVLLLASPTAPAALRGTKTDKLPRSDEPAKPGPETAPPIRRQRIFGIGVGFEPSGTLAGVALKIVLPDSPAYRAGLLPGCIVSEINGEAIAGRTGEDCARIIRDGGNTVKIKFLDPAMRERTITLDKQWITVPE
jgi:hypothetical protein